MSSNDDTAAKSAADARRQRRIKDLSQSQGDVSGEVSNWINDNFRTLRRATLAAALIGVATAVYASPRYARRKPEELLYLAQVGKLKRTPCQAVHVDRMHLGGTAPNAPHTTPARGGTQLPLLWLQHAPAGRQLREAAVSARVSVESLLADGAVPVLPVACRLTGHPKADALGLRWLKRHLHVSPASAADAGVPFPELRTRGGFHPSLLHVTAAGVVTVPRGALRGGDAAPSDEAPDDQERVSCIVATVQRPRPWWAALPAWALRRVVNEHGLFAHESLFLTGPVTRYAEDAGQHPEETHGEGWWQTKQPSPNRADSASTAQAAAGAAASQQQGENEDSKKAGHGGRIKGFALSALAATRSASAAAAAPLGGALSKLRSAVGARRPSDNTGSNRQSSGSEDGASALSKQRSASAPRVPAAKAPAQAGMARRAASAALSAPAAIWKRLPRWLRRTKEQSTPRSKAVYSPPRGFSVPAPAPEKQGVWARMLTWRRHAPAAQLHLPPHPDGPQATDMQHVQQAAHPRDVLFSLGSVSLGAHLARHGAAVADTTLTLQLTRDGLDGGGTRAADPHMRRVELQWAAPVHALAAAVGDTEEAQTAAAAHGVGVWADEGFAGALAAELDDERRH